MNNDHDRVPWPTSLSDFVAFVGCASRTSLFVLHTTPLFMTNQAPQPDRISKIKHRLRQSRFLSIFMGCPYPAPRWEKAVKEVLRHLGQEARILDLGSGLDRRTPNTINLEIDATPNVDVLGDGHCSSRSRTPFSTPSSRKPFLSMCKIRIWLSRKCIACSSLMGMSAPPCRSCRGFTHRRTIINVTRCRVLIIFFRRLRELRAGRAPDRQRRCTGFSENTSGWSFLFRKSACWQN